MPPVYQNEYYVDGGCSNNLPVDENTISIQPWDGIADICPRDNVYTAMNCSFANANVNLTSKNMGRIRNMLFPSSVDGK